MTNKIKNLKDTSGLIDQLVHELEKNGSARLVHFGLFKIKEIKGHKRYDFKARKVVPMEPYKQIIFTPSKGIREMLRDGKMAADRSNRRKKKLSSE